MHKATVCPTSSRANFAALFVFNYFLREFLLSAVANCFELQFRSKVTGAIVLQNPSLLDKSRQYSTLYSRKSIAVTSSLPMNRKVEMYLPQLVDESMDLLVQ